ncbi:MAG: glycosyltransferase, partial [Desulfobacterales bacterium]|nr:glycosyltransferase [Desulfobacterales bacterium]
DMKGYFRMLKRSRIVVTCNPDPWEGDHRTWEAFANGALVFVDRMFTPMVHPLVDGKHCIFYDISISGIDLLKKKVRHYLDNPSEAEAIAKEGHEFTMKHHRTSSRIDDILEKIT